MKVGEGAGGFDTAIVDRELMRIACYEMCDRWCDLKRGRCAERFGSALQTGKLSFSISKVG